MTDHLSIAIASRSVGTCHKVAVVNIKCYWTQRRPLFAVLCRCWSWPGHFTTRPYGRRRRRDPACPIIFYILQPTVFYALHSCTGQNPGSTKHERRGDGRRRGRGRVGPSRNCPKIGRHFSLRSPPPLRFFPDNFIILIWISMQCSRRANHHAMAPLRVCTFSHELTLYARFSLSLSLSLSKGCCTSRYRLETWY